MIRVNFCKRKASYKSEEEFLDFYRKVYGPLIAKHQTTLDIRRYVQSYNLTPDKIGSMLRESRPEMHEPFDGTGTFWWHDLNSMEQALKSSAGKATMEELIACEKEFVDLSKSSIFLSKEVPQINPMPENGILALSGSPIIKLVYVLHALPTLGREKCQLWWQVNHGCITRQNGVALGFLRYIQSHTIDNPLIDLLRKPREALEPYDGLTEVWFDRAELNSLLNDADCEGQEAFGLLLEDEYKFVDMARSSTWFTKEHVLVDSGF